MDYVSIAINFLGSLGLFVFGINVLAAGLQKVAGNKMKRILESLTKTRYMGVLLGAGVAAIIQSSTATTVMVVGFVNAGIMNLSQVVGVIMGANIGTTTTAWLVSSIEWSTFLRPATLGSICAAVGAFMRLLSKRKQVRNLGEIIAAVGILFLGMTMMPDAVRPLREMDAFRQAFVSFGQNPLLGILTGFVVTAIIQSSTASVGILQSLAFSGLVPWSAAVYIIMGQNIGTTVTAIMSSFGASKNARSAAYIHLLFNVIGATVFGLAAFVFFRFNSGLGGSLISATEISVVHTGFSLGTMVLLYPFANILVKLSVKMAGKGKDVVDEGVAVHLDDRVLRTPSFALESSVKEILRLAHMARENVVLAIKLFLGKNEGDITSEAVYLREDNIDKLDEAITTYLVKLSAENLSVDQNARVTTLLKTIMNIERIADHAENIAELADAIGEEGLAFTGLAGEELEKIADTTILCLENAIAAISTNDIKLAQKAISQEEAVDIMQETYRTGHINRLTAGECNPRSGVIFVEMLNNLERITDHSKNIAETVGR